MNWCGVHIAGRDKSLIFGIAFVHTESLGNHEECTETRLLTQANPVGAIQLKAPSQRSFLVVIERSYSYNGHIPLTHYSGDREHRNVKMLFQRRKLLNCQVLKREAMPTVRGNIFY